MLRNIDAETWRKVVTAGLRTVQLTIILFHQRD
ncbi:Uncharacterised protein [Vibrio cholerae]|nr:Uncharacterised protein [Vibrio cholerae]